MDVASSEDINTKSISVNKLRPWTIKMLIARLMPYISIGDLFRRTFHAIIGVVKEVDTSHRRVLVTVPTLDRQIWGSYRPELERFLLANQGNLIEFEGKIKLDKDEMPYRVKSLHSARLADDSGISVSDVLPAHLRLKKIPDEVIEISLSDDKQTYFAEYKALDIVCEGHTRADIKEALEAFIYLDWKVFAMAPDEKLHSDAIAFKKKLHSIFEEV